MTWTKKVARSCLFLGGVLVCFGSLGPVSHSLPSHVHPSVVQAANHFSPQPISVIVSTEPDARSVERAATELGAEVTARWGFIHAFAAEVPVTKLGALARLPGVRAVLPNRRVTGQGNSIPAPGGVDTSTLLNAYNSAVQADVVWAGGYDGRGVTVAVVDSGVATGGPSDFGTRLIQSVKFNSDSRNAIDKYGHGTHVAGIIGGSGDASNGKYIGVAPGINLINVKFSDDDGTGSEKELINALQWIYDNRTRFNIRVVNLSSSVGTQQSYRESPTAAAVEQLWFGGVVVIVSAGNRGREPCSVCYAPANDPYVISVGAMDDKGTKLITDDTAVPWSSSGETMDGHIKPDLIAPGAHIISYMPKGQLRENNSGNIVDANYFKMGGTSMAAPMVAGVVALLLQAKPTLTPDEVKWLLMNTTRTYDGQPSAINGVVSAAGAVFYQGTPARANQGLTPSPLIDTRSGTINYSDIIKGNMVWGNMAWGNSVQF